MRKVSGEDGSQKSEDILARIELAMSQNNVDTAVAEAKKLNDTDKKDLAKWLINANDYAQAQAASEAILRYLTTHQASVYY